MINYYKSCVSYFERNPSFFALIKSEGITTLLKKTSSLNFSTMLVEYFLCDDVKGS